MALIECYTLPDDQKLVLKPSIVFGLINRHLKDSTASGGQLLLIPENRGFELWDPSQRTIVIKAVIGGIFEIAGPDSLQKRAEIWLGTQCIPLPDERVFRDFISVHTPGSLVDGVCASELELMERLPTARQVIEAHLAESLRFGELNCSNTNNLGRAA